MKGTVKFFDKTKNYGFIEPEDGSEDLFVHGSEVEEGILNEGDKVEFEVAKGDNGKGPKAVKVKKV